MNYIVIDLEYNQPFDFKKNGPAKPNAACPFEIVQMGIVKLNEKYEIIGKRNYLIKPQLYRRIHPYVAKITGLTKKSFENGVSFEIAFRSMVRFIGREKSIFCTWGSEDLRELFRNTLYYGLSDRKLSKHFIDVQRLVSRQLGNGSKCVGLKNAVAAMDLNQSLPFHDALNDACYTSELFKQVNHKMIADKNGKVHHIQRYNVRKLKDELMRIRK